MKKKRYSELQSPIIKKSFNYRQEAERLLNEAKHDFENNLYKDAYGKVGQSLRLFLSYHHGLKKELTNSEMIRYLKNQKKSFKHIKECLDLCSLVEFAKYKENKSDFIKIIQITSNVILQ
jgi:HEPN domain-containing protein